MTYDKYEQNNSFVRCGIGRQHPNGPIINLIEPKSSRDNNEEKRELNDDRLNQNKVVHPVDDERCPDAFERLPSKQLT